MSAVLPIQYVYPMRLDWKQILADLRTQGVSGYKVAQLMGVNWSTVQRWLKNGYEPGHAYAMALLAIHTRYCGEELTRKRHNEALPMD